jgi:hypothetical protein
MGYIDKQQLKEIISKLPKNSYRKYLEGFLRDSKRL